MVVPLAIILLGITYLFWHSRRQAQTLKKEIIDLKDVQEVLVTKAALKGRDEERQRIARDWHDGLGNILSTARLITDNLTTDNPAQLKEVQSLLEDSHQVSKNIIRNIPSDAIHSHEDLVAYLNILQSRLALGKINLTFSIVPSNRFTRLPKEDKWHFYNILQELVSNVIQHAQASTIQIHLKEKENLILTVLDNGKGFLATQKNIPKTIRERVQLLKGQLDIQPLKSQGTSVSITF